MNVYVFMIVGVCKCVYAYMYLYVCERVFVRVCVFMRLFCVF